MKFLTEPYLLTLKPSTEINILWIQDEKTDGFVQFGRDESLGNTLKAECYEIVGLRNPANGNEYSENIEDNPPVAVWQYIAKLENLTPGETIYYRVCAKDQKSDVYDFHTAPEAGSHYRFLQLSDLQGLATCNEPVYKAGCKHPDFILYSGDTTHVIWQIDQWFGINRQDENDRKRAFFPCMQQRNGARLMQYAPIFICPGNHELDNTDVYAKKDLYEDEKNWTWSIFMQMFRPLYPEMGTGAKGKRWYSADYSDMHITSLSINRLCFWPYDKAPGWRMYDPITPDSDQIVWLKNDLESSHSRYKWVIQHFHILNKGKDVQFNLCDAEIDENGNATYPHDYGKMLMDIYHDNKVNGVSFGHSHVYERYYHRGTHYIEAAYFSVCYRGEDEKPHPSGLLPIVADNSRRSFLIVEHNEKGLCASGFYEDDTEKPFDEYTIADENGDPVAP